MVNNQPGLKAIATAEFIRCSGRDLFFPDLTDEEYAALVYRRNSDPGVQAFVNQVSLGMARESSPSGMRKSFSDLVHSQPVVHHSDGVRCVMDQQFQFIISGLR